MHRIDVDFEITFCVNVFSHVPHACLTPLCTESIKPKEKFWEKIRHPRAEVIFGSWWYGRCAAHHQVVRLQQSQPQPTQVNLHDDDSLEIVSKIIDEQLRELLHLALRNGEKKTVESLLRCGANPNSANAQGSTALHIVCKRNDDDDLVKAFFNMCDAIGQTVFVDARDEWGDTALHPGRSIPIHEDDRAAAEKRASGALLTIEILESAGYELEWSDALTVMKFFAKHRLFEENLEKRWYDDVMVANEAKNEMTFPNLSLYDLNRMRPEEAETLLIFDLGYTRKLWELPNSGVLCHEMEILLRVGVDPIRPTIKNRLLCIFICPTTSVDKAVLQIPAEHQDAGAGQRTGLQGLVNLLILYDAIVDCPYPLFQRAVCCVVTHCWHLLLIWDIFLELAVLVPSCECGSRFCRRWQVPQFALSATSWRHHAFPADPWLPPIRRPLEFLDDVYQPDMQTTKKMCKSRTRRLSLEKISNSRCRLPTCHHANQHQQQPTDLGPSSPKRLASDNLSTHNPLTISRAISVFAL
ncbi:unnamed protein product [Trichogramma brassicae]|uniref:Uncharacterized protein n=1 Tax=Trichogramma brassicae TaxID=86971 RepID=A0A6H5HTP8_9HYME|nr:unnamed protein product [Trichogramma brassicae]